MLASGGPRARGHRAFVWYACAAAVLAVVAGVTVLVAPGARADSTSQLVQLTNSARGSHGLPPLAVSANLATLARRQAARMAGAGALSHTPNLAGVVCCWSAVGENVGEGRSVAVIQQAFMASPPHRANILSTSYTQIGVGTAVDSNGTLWVSEIFRRPNTTAAPPPPPAPAPPAPPATEPTTARTRRPAPTPTRVAHRPAKAAQSAPAPAPHETPTSQAPPAATSGGRASRDLPGGRLPPAEAARFAASLAAESVIGADPVSRMLDFVAATST